MAALRAGSGGPGREMAALWRPRGRNGGSRGWGDDDSSRVSSARNGAAPERRVRLRRARPVPAARSTVPPPSCASRAEVPLPVPPGPAMLRLEPLCFLLLLLLPHVGRAASPVPPAAPTPLNGTEAPRPTVGNGTRAGLAPGSRRPLLSGLPVLKRAVYVLSALSLLAALYFLLQAFRPRSEGPRNERKTRFRLKKPQRKKYGLLSNYDENIEMASLDSDEDTVFETRNPRR
ncbi:protein FAM174C [Porphyrio hochstetteri]